MRLHSIFTIFSLLAMGDVAFADSPKWFAEPDASTAGGAREVKTLSKGGVAYFENDDATTDSLSLVTVNCNPAVMSFNPDEDGTSTGAEVYLWALDSSTTTTTANNGTKVQPDTDGDGIVNDVTFDGSTAARTAIAFRANAILVETAANPATADEFRVTVECY